MRLAAIFSSGMVLQRDCEIPVWGWAEPGDGVAVECAGNKARVRAASNGSWRVTLPALPAGGPHRMTVSAADQTEYLDDILIGEVWICSGQSNMEFALSATVEGVDACATADVPGLRFFTVPHAHSIVPLSNTTSRWVACIPREASKFSAVAYYFGRELHERLKVPVGLVNCSWGGTLCQAWTSREGLEADSSLHGYVEQLDSSLNQNTEEGLAEYETARRKFLAEALPQDAGNRGFSEGWAGAGFDDSGWSRMTLPNYWSCAGHPTNGVFWFRQEVEVPEAWAGHDLILSLGWADKSDDTYFNGHRVGGLTWVENEDSWQTPREYPVPSALVKPGRNVIAVRVMSNYTGGGLAGPASSMELSPRGLSGAKPLPLAGDWLYAVEQDFGKVAAAGMPVRPRDHNVPSALFNGMIAPLIPFALRGAIWYQGESNADDHVRYRTLFPAMIRDWRSRWEVGDFPFYFVQLANFVSKDGSLADYENSPWAMLREAQSHTRTLPNTGMAVAIDIGEARDIHPRNKRDVGLRLAVNALAQTYGQNVVYKGPVFKGLHVEGNTVWLEFDHAEGLNSSDGVARGFAVAGVDRVFKVASGRIEGASVVVSSPAVKEPVAARYGWGDCPACTLYNASKLPAEPFRTDNWPLHAGPEREGLCG